MLWSISQIPLRYQGSVSQALSLCRVRVCPQIGTELDLLLSEILNVFTRSTNQIHEFTPEKHDTQDFATKRSKESISMKTEILWKWMAVEKCYIRMDLKHAHTLLSFLPNKWTKIKYKSKHRWTVVPGTK